MHKMRSMAATGVATWRYGESIDMAAIRHILAVFAAHVATSLPWLAAILPPLPPITPSVKFPRDANRLEFSIREERATDQKSKSGKNGNVDHPTQHCRQPLRAGFSQCEMFLRIMV